MAINSVSSSTGAAAKTVQQPRPQQAESRKPQATGSADEAAKAHQAEQQAKKPEPAKTVVNAEGHKTGRVINVTA